MDFRTHISLICAGYEVNFHYAYSGRLYVPINTRLTTPLLGLLGD